jgi:hypothetical protein
VLIVANNTYKVNGLAEAFDALIVKFVFIDICIGVRVSVVWWLALAEVVGRLGVVAAGRGWLKGCAVVLWQFLLALFFVGFVWWHRSS